MGNTTPLNHTLSLRELESLLTMLARPQALIEVGLIFDLVVVISVAALFSARIHEQLGTADTGLLREIRE